jgi:hypothetical protein
MKFKTILLLALICGYSSTYAQKIVRSSFNAFGNVTQNDEIKLSQTAGQASNYSVFYSTDQAIALRQGFQQVNSNIVGAKNKALNFTVYPNPNNGTFSVTFNERIDGALNCRLIDNQGRIFKDDIITANGTNHFNYTLPSGSYILQLKTPEGKSGIAKIIILP